MQATDLGIELTADNAIDDLLEKLEDKIKKIEKKLENGESHSKRKHLKLELKIAAAELKKGERRRKELKGICK